NESSHVTVSQDSEITSRHGAVDINADGEVANVATAEPTIYFDGTAGLGLGLSIDKSDINAEVNGKIDAGGGSEVTFSPTAVNTAANTITLPSLPYAEGDSVVYHAPADGAAVGGLTDGATYHVHIVNPNTNTIQLVSSLGIPLENAEVNPASTQTLSRMATRPFDSSAVNASANTIAVTGFRDGQLVTYVGDSTPIPGLQQSHQYKVHLAAAGKITL